MKNFIIINGTMGVGKSETSRDLKKQLSNCVFLDGDWCWNMNPVQINDVTKKMVMDNIVYILRNFLTCPDFDNVIFCWDLHKESMIDEMMERLEGLEFKCHKYSLVCTEEALAKRIGIDFAEGRRTENILEKSLKWLHNYYEMNTEKIDVTSQSSWQAASYIAAQIKAGQ